MRVVLVRFRDYGLRPRNEKFSPDFFVPIFGQGLREYGIELDLAWADELRRSPERYRNQLLILVYREVWALRNAAVSLLVKQMERVALENKNVVLHGIELGQLIANKRRTNQVLNEAGIAVP